MALVKISFDVELTEINCGSCGGTYAINERYRRQQYEKGGSWTCPYCKVGWGYAAGNDEKTKLQKQLADEQRRREFAEKNAAAERAAREATERSARAIRGATTRVRNRIKNGVCPCCNRTFQNLLRHMGTEHPDFNPGHVVTG